LIFCKLLQDFQYIHFVTSNHFRAALSDYMMLTCVSNHTIVRAWRPLITG